MNYKILKDGEIKIIIISKFHKFEFKYNILNSVSEVETGFNADKLQKKLIEDKHDEISVKQGIRNFVCSMINKIIEQSLIKFSIVYNSLCLNPLNMAKDKKECISKMKSIVNCLIENGWNPRK